jgi:hypothetical protein
LIARVIASEAKQSHAISALVEIARLAMTNSFPSAAAPSDQPEIVERGRHRGIERRARRLADRRRKLLAVDVVRLVPQVRHLR